MSTHRLAKLSALALLAAAAASAPAISFADDAGGGWEYVTTDDGVVVYRKEVPGSDVVAFKGVTYTELPIGRILAVFQDGGQRPHWVDRYEEHKTLDKGPEWETYWIHFGLPWPVSDRDYVLNAQGKADQERRVYTVQIKSVEHPKKGIDDCCVRAVVYGTYYEFSVVPGENKVKMLVEVHTDPKGSLPSWLVNLIQKSWPSKTLNGLIRRAKEVNVPPFPPVATWHEKKAPAPAPEAPAAAPVPAEASAPAAEASDESN
jgi:hypothetical protein